MFSKPESSSSRPRFNYDVFLSFRGEDTRYNFTDHLYAGLVQAGIHTFRDDNELPRGEEISPQLIKAIRESRISMVIFSKGYADSRWCLDELAEILYCKRTSIHQIVLPVFYDIDPSDVRKQKGSFAEAFERHEGRFKEEMEKLKRWREALKEVANLSGWNLKDVANGHEAKFIQKIVEDVSNKLERKYLNVSKCTLDVGIEPRVNNVTSLLSIGSNDVCILGIHGMAGIGKTTIAKAVFNELCYGFEGSCFLFNVKEMSKGPSGLVHLQKQLLSDILKSDFWKINHVDCGINLIKERLCCKRVLIVLDDADNGEQLDALVGDRSWFGYGSKIIITTRDERLLTQYEVDKKFEAEVLNDTESLQLFSWHAFRDTHPAEGFWELAIGVMDYCRGLPLALEVLGSSLFKRSKLEWKSIIKKLKEIPSNEIHKKLRTSFDSLDDRVFKNAFLDIACFFVGWDKEYVVKILDGRGFYADIAIRILVERSLVKINHYNQLDMHDLIRDMGREIVREKSLDYPGKRSRIWLQKDVLNVLKEQSGTEAVEGLTLDVLGAAATTTVDTESFKEMTFLKLLKINGVHLTGSFEHLSKELVWLCWHECPKFFPPNFLLDNLVILDIQHSNIKELWKGTKFLDKLKILDLSYSMSLTKTPCLRSSSLEKLILVGCSSLVEVDQSIGHLQNLVCLNLEGCCRLKILPESMGDLKSLESLNLTRCSQLEKLPERLGDMQSLYELLGDETAVNQLPSSIGSLKNLNKISLSGRKELNWEIPFTSWIPLLSSWLSPRSSNSKALLPATFSCLSSLRDLNLSYCGLSESVNSVDFGCLSSLKWLDLSGNKFLHLIPGIGRLPNLLLLIVKKCPNLLSISDLPSRTDMLRADGCTSLERLSVHQLTSISSICLDGCQKLIEIQGIEDLERPCWNVGLRKCYSLSTNSRKSIVQELLNGEGYEIYLMGNEIPEWFGHCGEGSSISFRLPIAVPEGNKLQALDFWVVFVGDHRRRITFVVVGAEVSIEHKSKGTLLLKKKTCAIFPSNSFSWVSHISLLDEQLFLCAMLDGGDELELRVELECPIYGGEVFIKIVKCGIHLAIENSDASWKDRFVRELQQSQIFEAKRSNIWEKEMGNERTAEEGVWKTDKYRKKQKQYL